jgi:hypothetical protein
VIIDDGLHSIEANIKTLLSSLSYLAPGGWFIVEDIPGAALDVWRLIAEFYSLHNYEPVLVEANDGYIFGLRNLAGQ